MQTFKIRMGRQRLKQGLQKNAVSPQNAKELSRWSAATFWLYSLITAVRKNVQYNHANKRYS